jgi:[ribosomal protein S5]-alanine N-acetyltransferase
MTFWRTGMIVSPIETQRLWIRQFERDDWQDVADYASDAEVTTYLPEGRRTVEQTKAFVTENLGEPATAFAVVLKAERRLIGHMPFHPWFAPRTFEIGWVLNKRYHERGFATEAAAALLDYGFEALTLHRVIATCQPENVASYRVMEKIGMRREGHFRKCIDRGDATWWDEYFYAILEEEWVRGKANAPA